MIRLRPAKRGEIHGSRLVQTLPMALVRRYDGTKWERPSVTSRTNPPKKRRKKKVEKRISCLSPRGTSCILPPPPVDHTHTRTKPPRTPPLRKALSSIYLYTTNVFMACLPLGCRVTAERPPSAPPTTPPPIPARNSIIADKIYCVGRVTAGLIYTRPSPKYTSGGWVPNLNAAELRGWTGERGPGLACKLNVHVLLFLQRER